MREPPKEFFLPFVRQEQMSKDAYAFYFDRKKESFDFLAGQYIRMFLDISNPDERGTQRFFSITSTPLEKDILSITTRIIQSSFKKSLLELKVGTNVKFFGPMGRFILEENDTTPKVLLAGGIGITPMHSMVKYAAQKKLSIPIVLFASFSSRDELVFYDELQSFSNESIKIVYTITHEDALGANWTGETGRISKEMIEKYVSNWKDSTFMMSGPPVMVLAMENMAQEMGVTPENIKKEQFTGY